MSRLFKWLDEEKIVAEAKKNKKTKKPRVRKAPTMREQVEIAQSKTGPKKPGRIKKASKVVAKPIKKVKVPRNRFTRTLAWPLTKIWRIAKKVLGWLVPKYFINAWREVKLVTWPNRHETFRLMITVLIFAIVFGALVTGVDKILDKIFKELVLG